MRDLLCIQASVGIEAIRRKQFGERVELGLAVREAMPVDPGLQTAIDTLTLQALHSDEP